MTHERSQSWFGRLRRDGAMFALLCALILLGNMLQPLSAAQAASGNDGWTLCTTHGVDRADVPGGDSTGHPHDCCTAGNHCGGLAAPKLLPSAEAAFAPPAALTRLPYASADAVAPARNLAGPPPAIRAPPFFA